MLPHRVASSLVGMPTQVVPQIDVVAVRLIALDHDVQMVVRTVPRSVERFATKDAEISLTGVPDSNEPLDGRRDITDG